ncbi:unnamed protein product [Microthlaspi erraticum]|uniref:Uncharacterized protein n=1 Tax=Microthlaspi erraticum TaxID=1685480 RepID=A0A6D2KB12_9BRAS|nr:unnamed protein product [Microthlaspi erraticum]
MQEVSNREFGLLDETSWKRSYNQKSEDCPDGSIENQRPNRAVRLAEERTFPRSARITSVRLKSRPKSKTVRPITHHDPGNCPRSATPQPLTPCRASREQSLAAAQPSRVPRPMRRPSRELRPASAEKSSANLIRPTTAADHESVRPRPFRSYRTADVRPIVPTDRPNAAVDPKPVLKPVSHIFKPGLTLSRL